MNTKISRKTPCLHFNIIIFIHILLPIYTHCCTPNGKCKFPFIPTVYTHCCIHTVVYTQLPQCIYVSLCPEIFHFPHSSLLLFLRCLFLFFGGFFCLHSHYILTILYVLREPHFSSFDYTALHIKGAQLLEVK